MEYSFESAFERLEQILEQINKPGLSLDDSIKLYEEADRLIALCEKRLVVAEQRVEMLVKTRNGSLVLDACEKPEKVPLSAGIESDQLPF